MFFVAVCSHSGMAQIQPMGNTPGSMNNPRDTASNKTNNKEWKDETARVSFKQLNSQKVYTPDTGIHTFHRRPFLQPWHRDLGNMGSAARNLLFTPQHRVGPTFGYNVFDIYRYEIDSLPFYNTTRPYSIFTYLLGSKLEQVSQLLHSQNITPYWNVTAQYRKINSQGFYKAQRMNHDNAFLTTNYKSKKQHYELNAAFTYNKEQQDENGGITDETLLDSEDYTDRKVIPINFDNSGYSDRRSPVTNVLRDYSILLQHSYTAGKEDSVYNEDSTKFTYRLIPRFRLTHRMEFRSDKHQYKDMTPDSLRYTGLFERSFLQDDSVFAEQRWLKLDNRLLLNGYFGKPGKQVAFSAGIGNRYDKFRSRYIVDSTLDEVYSNYLVGELKKEILQEGQWGYNVRTQFYFTGKAAGDFIFHASAGKSLRNFGRIELGVQQQLQSNSYNDSIYANQFVQYRWNFTKENIAQVYADVYSDKLNLWLGLRSYVVSNYIYMNQFLRPTQDAGGTFNLSQLSLRKLFNFGHFVIDNEFVLQYKTGGAPVNVPLYMDRFQFAWESYMFKRALKVAVGIEARLHEAYTGDSYSPFFNRYHYQDSYLVHNIPEGTFFFNFKIKQFRASLSLDQLQQLFERNIITSQNYPGQDFMLRFGFSWTLIN